MKKILSTLGFVTLFVLASCSRSDFNEAQLESQSVDVSQVKNVPDVAFTTQAVQKFVSDVSELGVKLKQEELKTISTQRHLKTTGVFASRPAEHLSSEQNLSIHFNKHKGQFPNVKTKEEYLAAAKNYLDNNTTAVYYFDTTSFAKKYQSNVIKYDKKTTELSAMRLNGDITTYYKDNKVDPKRFVVVPAEFFYQ